MLNDEPLPADDPQQSDEALPADEPLVSDERVELLREQLERSEFHRAHLTDVLAHDSVSPELRADIEVLLVALADEAVEIRTELDLADALPAAPEGPAACGCGASVVPVRRSGRLPVPAVLALTVLAAGAGLALGRRLS